MEPNGVINIWCFFIETLKEVGMLSKMKGWYLPLSGSAEASNQFCGKPFKCRASILHNGDLQTRLCWYLRRRYWEECLEYDQKKVPR